MAGDYGRIAPVTLWSRPGSRERERERERESRVKGEEGRSESRRQS